MQMRIPLFRIWYSTTYTVLFIVVVVLLAISPGETIYQSVRSKELQKLFVIGGAYTLTAFIVFLIYSTRLYTNRSVLQAIPKPYIPIEDGEVGKLVRRMIVKAFKRSAIIAWDSRPRDVRGEAGAHGDGDAEAERNHATFRRRSHHVETTIIPVSAKSPPWGHVSHPGWASPSSPDIPNVQYWDVVAELPNLIEAKAVSLAPPDPALDMPRHMLDNTPILPDAEIVALLQRPRTTGLRDYLGQLSSYGLINPPTLGPKFLAQYEYARFSTRSLSEPEFRAIMTVFAEVLNGMTDLDPIIVEEARALSLRGDTDNRSLAPSSYSASSTSTRSNLPYQTPRTGGGSEHLYGSGTESPQTVRTALSMMRTLSESAYTVPRTPSERSLGSEAGSVVFRPIQRSPSTILPNSSSDSGSSTRSAKPVVRLRSSPGAGELPYQYHLDEG
ncbi:hypothetical protein K504DRAFT_467189 [Pleomassaria siparia CBS 279.74]|uniref:Defect at low temperature protein 1 n=1 Tax=Pleomassaria siparia CBS 279.74 TaxID=1314801 RepID=A0A6G1K9B8_9PLEO|nr:hypothetical protein K504DRAFT_467189 [Pleomassaria siparia CBS 279.74]